MRAGFVYPNSRRQLLGDVAAGRAPDSGLLGMNHLTEHGIEAAVVEPRVQGTNRLRWHVREIALAFEVRGFDVLATPLSYHLPLLMRLTRGPRSVVLNYGLTTIFGRASRARRRLLSESLRSAAFVVSLGSSQRDEITALAGLDPDRSLFAPFGVDADFFQPDKRSAEPLVLTVGKDLARDLATFGSAVAGLPVRIVAVTLPRNLAGVDLPDNVEVLHEISWEHLRSLYASASVVVIPLRASTYRLGSEASGLTALLEAMAMARPVVATDRSVFADYVTRDVDAGLVQPEDPGALREAILRVLEAPEAAEAMGVSARLAVEHRFTSRQFAARLAPVLRAALANNTGADNRSG